jgi:O-antigen ligase
MQPKMEQVHFWLLMLLAFSLPLSTSAVSVTAVLLIVCWVAEGRFREKVQEIVTSPLCLGVFVYLGVLLIGLCWTDSFADGVQAIRKQWKILLAPLFLTSIQWERRWWYIAAFIAGVTATMAVISLDSFALLPAITLLSHPIQFDTATVQLQYTPMLALAIYLLLHQFLWGGSKGTRWWLLILAIVLIIHLFATRGRAGYVAFFVLMAVLLVQYYHRNVTKAVILAAVLFPLIFFAAYRVSPVFQDRMTAIQHDLKTIDENPDTSVGLRLHYWKISWGLIKESPWIGVGTGDFARAFAEMNTRVSPAVPPTNNPHNQYVFAAVQLGVLGLLSVFGLFFVHFQRAVRVADGWERIRIAFPVFFLVIMCFESYLNLVGTGFMFSLVSAILFKQAPAQQGHVPGSRSPGGGKRYWLILSYRVNVPGSACSQHIDDRLPLLEQAGITPLLLSGPIGGRFKGRRHYQTWSIAPSGMRFELRHFLRRHLPRQWQFNLAEVLLFPLLPFYLLEKMLINLESEWSWFVGATVRGFFLQQRYRPEVLYSTGGSASAHLVALMLHRDPSVQWIAETQDPLVHGDWPRSQKVLRLYRWLEQRIASRCDAFIFLTSQALEHARQRAGCHFPGAVVYPGATMRRSEKAFVKSEVCRFAHFGSLAGSRNLVVFFEALHQLLLSHPEEGRKVRLDIYGSFDTESRQSMDKLRLTSLVTYHGLIDRQKAFLAMEAADCLLLIQNISDFSSETIPSKAYEYFLSGRPILGLIYHNKELTSMLETQSHFVAPADDPGALKEVLRKILALHGATSFCWESHGIPAYTTEQAVKQLIAVAEQRQPTDLPECVNRSKGI